LSYIQTTLPTYDTFNHSPPRHSSSIPEIPHHSYILPFCEYKYKYRSWLPRIFYIFPSSHSRYLCTYNPVLISCQRYIITLMDMSCGLRSSSTVPTTFLNSPLHSTATRRPISKMITTRPIADRGSLWPVDTVADGESPLSRLIRVLTCSKIRCCGGAPCKNCEKASKACDYEPVPDEVNKATREKKAASKAARQTHVQSTPSVYSTPYYAPMPHYDPSFLSVPAPPTRPMHLGHRRSSSAPNFSDWSTTTPAMPVVSPPVYDTGMQQGWYTTETSYPSVLAPMAEYQPVAEPYQMPSAWSVPDMQNYMAPQHDLSGQMPATPLNPQPRSNTTSSATLSSAATLSSPATPAYYAPSIFQTPYAPSPAHGHGSGSTVTSPTLAPEYKLPKDGLVGLGISQSQQNTPIRHPLAPSAPIGTMGDENYFSY
jgi:hypothetical protein